MSRSRLALVLVAAAVLLAAPLSLTGFWLQTGLFAMAAAIGAIGLTLLVGVTGQLSLGHAFFVFLNAETDAVAVLYRRRDGNYGLIEPVLGNGRPR